MWIEAFTRFLAQIPLSGAGGVRPDLQSSLPLPSMDCMAAAGQRIGVKALRLGEASVTESLQRTQIVYAPVFGYSCS